MGGRALRRFGTFKWRLVLILISVMFVVIVPISVIINFWIEAEFYEGFARDVRVGESAWQAEGEMGPEDLWNDLRKDGDRNLSTFLFNSNTVYKTYTVCDASALDEGSVVGETPSVYSSDPMFRQSPQQFVDGMVASPNFLSALSGGGGNARVLTRDGGRSYFDYAFTKNGYVVYFRYYSEDWSHLLGSLNNIVLAGMAASLAFAVPVGYFLSGTITKPVKNIMNKANAIAAGNFDLKLEVKSEDEIGQLGRTVNYMTAELKDKISVLSSEMNKLETLLGFITDGVVAFNLRGGLIHSNPAALRMLGVDGIGVGFNEFTETYGLDMTIEEVAYIGFKGRKERILEIGDSYIIVSFVLFNNERGTPDGVIALFQDMTEYHRLELMRKEFVANVSHELKTPITSIKLYADTLLEELGGEAARPRRFLEVICVEAERMRNLVSDLLQLSSIDYKQSQLAIKDVDLVGLTDSSIEKLSLHATARGLSVERHSLSKRPIVAPCDAAMMEQVLLNVLSNAIKYSPEGGVVSVYLEALYGDAIVKVCDNGIGIPKNDLPRVFERFYRVDKARSRELGGTGLGLAIAKEIMDAHGGSISIASVYGKGTEVTVRIKGVKIY
ncbi:MAG: cell wall metabolism sensor histidine kinase WalK [Oscillospiraceae bacterium]|nr:cell wall metabolism sensor histidine kinase WalK [Oscillospiraceae bacterium]